MRTRRRGLGWILGLGLLGAGAAGCQTIVEPDRTLIPDGGGGGDQGGAGGEGGGGGDQGGGGQGGGGGAGGN